MNNQQSTMSNGEMNNEQSALSDLNGDERYLGKLKRLADRHAHEVYRISKKLPSVERYGIRSQLTRASLSVILNIVEGYTRKSGKDFLRFMEIAHGSLRESSYLIDFCVEEDLLTLDEVTHIKTLSDEIGAMLWGVIKKHKY